MQPVGREEASRCASRVAMSSAVSRSVSILRTDMDSLLNYLVSLCFRGRLLREGEGEIDVLRLNFCLKYAL